MTTRETFVVAGGAEYLAMALRAGRQVDGGSWVTFEPCPICGETVAGLELWHLTEPIRGLRPEEIFGLGPTQMVVELAPCGHEPARRGSEPIYWLNKVPARPDGPITAVTWECRLARDDAE